MPQPERVAHFAPSGVAHFRAVRVAQFRAVEVAQFDRYKHFWFIQGVKGFNSNLFTVSGIVLIIFCLLYFYQIIQELPEPYIERMVMFWVGAGVFFYFGTNLFLFVTVDRLIAKAGDNFLVSWGLHNGSNAVKNILFTVAFFVAAKRN